jgi:hypothetical protein
LKSPTGGAKGAGAAAKKSKPVNKPFDLMAELTSLMPKIPSKPRVELTEGVKSLFEEWLLINRVHEVSWLKRIAVSMQPPKMGRQSSVVPFSSLSFEPMYSDLYPLSKQYLMQKAIGALLGAFSANDYQYEFKALLAKQSIEDGRILIKRIPNFNKFRQAEKNRNFPIPEEVIKVKPQTNLFTCT